jgi:hypothetical protein
MDNTIIEETIEKYRKEYCGKLIRDKIREEFLLIVDAEYDSKFKTLRFRVISKNKVELLPHGITLRFEIIPETET